MKDVNVPKEKFASETSGDSVPISSLTFFVGKPPYTYACTLLYRGRTAGFQKAKARFHRQIKIYVRFRCPWQSIGFFIGPTFAKVGQDETRSRSFAFDRSCCGGSRKRQCCRASRRSPIYIVARLAAGLFSYAGRDCSDRCARSILLFAAWPLPSDCATLVNCVQLLA